MDLGLNDRIALVTGAGQGMGRSIALKLAEEGAHLVLNDIAEDKAQQVCREVKELGRQAIVALANVAELGEVQAMFTDIRCHFPRVDILVNNAGLGGAQPFAQSTKADWDRAILVCLYGTIFCTRQVIPMMIEQRWGKIISILSDAGRVGEPELEAYSAAKAGILGFTKSLAKEMGRYNINVNCVSAGATLTDNILARHQAYREKYGEEAFREREKKILRKYPLGRYGQPEDVANAVAFFASDVSRHVTGQCLSVSGGYSMVS